MILYPMNQLLANVPSRYELVNLVAHRARQLYGEAEKKKEELKEKPVTIALNEAFAGTLTADSIPEDKQPAEQAAESEEPAAEQPEAQSEEPSEAQPEEAPEEPSDGQPEEPAEEQPEEPADEQPEGQPEEQPDEVPDGQPEEQSAGDVSEE